MRFPWSQVLRVLAAASLLSRAAQLLLISRGQTVAAGWDFVAAMAIPTLLSIPLECLDALLTIYGSRRSLDETVPENDLGFRHDTLRLETDSPRKPSVELECCLIQKL
jgi:hypothetical protein